MIVCISGGKGRRHDFRVFKESGVRFGPSVKHVLADSGYQGLQKLCGAAVLPVKGSKKKPLSKADKAHNHGLASKRTRVEHLIHWVKVFPIFREPYRNRRKRFFMRMNLVSAIVNLNIKN